MHNSEYIKFIAKFEPAYNQTVNAIAHKSALLPSLASIGELFFTPFLKLAQTGKRVRPYLVYLGAEKLSKSVIDVGIALELFHLFALIHDDIMDQSDTRRGIPSAHRQYQARTLDGVSGAILLGDYLLATANELMIAAAPRLYPEFCAMQKTVIAGQFYEMSLWGKRVSRSELVSIAELKSGIYTIQYPLHFGCAVAKKPIDTFDSFARLLGIAFQMRDDWHDLQHDHDEQSTERHIPNLVQLLLVDNNNDREKTKQVIVGELAGFKKKIIGQLNRISTTKKEALNDLTTFCCTID